jgi:hypothetical protein
MTLCLRALLSTARLGARLTVAEAALPMTRVILVQFSKNLTESDPHT